MNKEELINNFLTRLVDSYGYSAEQICTDFIVGDGVTIDIAIGVIFNRAGISICRMYA